MTQEIAEICLPQSFQQLHVFITKLLTDNNDANNKDSDAKRE